MSCTASGIGHLEDYCQSVLREVSIYADLPAELRPLLFRRLHELLQRVEFFGKEGLEITDEMRVLVLGQAAFLQLGDTTQSLSRLHSVWLYPGTIETSNGAGPVSYKGYATQFGRVALAWDAVQHGMRMSEGRNVVLHEIAHIVDLEDAVFDGKPLRPEYCVLWEKVRDKAFNAFRNAHWMGKADLLSSYGAIDQVEFFAVATEVFFERPAALKLQFPEIYSLLRETYRIDPAGWRTLWTPETLIVSV